MELQVWKMARRRFKRTGIPDVEIHLGGGVGSTIAQKSLTWGRVTGSRSLSRLEVSSISLFLRLGTGVNLSLADCIKV